jgi:acetoin utilization deacetylase AcuC-like enzyme
MSLQSHFWNDTSVNFCPSPLASIDELTKTHDYNYVNRFLTGSLTDLENRRIGFPWSAAGVARTCSSVGGTIAAMRSVCSQQCSVAGHLAGGTHHAFFDRGEGFCVFSDIAVAANLALAEYASFIKSVLVIDLDVHQGNGNAALFQNTSNVFTFSVHCKGNYFSEKQRSDLDIEVNDGCGDDEYLDILSDSLPQVIGSVKPDLVFYQGTLSLLTN